MSNFAKVINKIVVELIVADSDFINSGVLGDPTLWILTNTTQKAKLGSVYDVLNNTFIPPNPNPSWDYNPEKNQWEAPSTKPSEVDAARFIWDEDTVSWIETTEATNE